MSFLKKKDVPGTIDTAFMVVVSSVSIVCAIRVLFTKVMEEPLTTVNRGGVKELSFTMI